MLRIEGSYTFNASREVVWEALVDANVLARALPGGERLEQVGEHEYRGVMNIRVGPVQGRFEGTVTLSEVNPPESYHLRVRGRGAPGFVNGEGDLRLEERDGKTVLHYSGEAQLGGRIANVGQRLLDSTAKSLTRQGLEALDQQIQARLQAQTAGKPAPEVVAPSPARVAAEVARDVLADLVPPEQRPLVIAGAIGVLILLLLLLVRLLRR